MAFNYLTAIPEGIVDSCKHLRWIRLQNNQFPTITHYESQLPFDNERIVPDDVLVGVFDKVLTRVT